MAFFPTEQQIFKKDRASTELGKVYDGGLTYSVTRATVGSSSAEALAASTAITRKVLIFVPATAETGIYLNFGGTAAASATGFLLPSGSSVEISTTQAINAIRAGSSDVSVHMLVGGKT